MCVYQYFTWTFTDKDFGLCLAIQAKEYFAVHGLFFKWRQVLYIGSKKNSLLMLLCSRFFKFASHYGICFTKFGNSLQPYHLFTCFSNWSYLICCNEIFSWLLRCLICLLSYSTDEIIFCLKPVKHKARVLKTTIDKSFKNCISF